MIKHKCKHLPCYTLLDEAGYCDKHKHLAPQPFKNADNPNEALYSSYRWKQLRARLLNGARCSVIGCCEHKLTLHHVIPPRGNEDLFYDEGNIVILCSKHHFIETKREIAERKTHTPTSI